MNLRLGYRVRQFWNALAGGSKPVDEAVLSTYLNAAQLALFRRMSASEQQHALAVLCTLQQHGHSLGLPNSAVGRQSRPGGGEHPATVRREDRRSCAQTGIPEARREQGNGVELTLARAVLLHDVGKVGGRIRLWHRVATVLLQALHPALLRRLALDEPRSWRYPFFVLLHHAQRGADLSAAVGTDELAVALIRAHHSAPEQSGLDAAGQALLAALRWADEQN